jgi:hypothetical protein
MQQLKETDILSQAQPREIYKAFKIGNLHASFRWRDGKNSLGRFGAGWQWALGFEASRSALLLHCLIFSLMIWNGKE